MSGSISVSGAVAAPATITAAMLAANYAPVTVTVGTDTYIGASVYSLITAAQFLYPTGGTVKNGALQDYIQVTGAPGSSVILSEGEVDPGFGGKLTTDIIAYSRNGAAIAPQLVVPGDINGGIGGRDVAAVTALTVGTASLAPAIPGAPAAPGLTVGGSLLSRPGTTNAAALQQGGNSASQTDVFLAGTTPNTYTFTGVPLSAVVSAAGLNPAHTLNDYVVATGSDGYGVVYSEGEIDPSIRTAPTALVAYDDGRGAFGTVGGTSGALRTTAPGDSKGGRYVSGLDSITVATPSNDAVSRLYEGALGRAPDAAGGAFWSGLLDAGTTLAQVAQGFLQSGEYTARFGRPGNTTFVSQLYQSELGRAADTGGATFWSGLLDGGTSRAAVLAGFSLTPEAILHTASLSGTMPAPA